MQILILALVGLAGGLINGFFGTGGGILPALYLGGKLEGTRRFATVLSVTLPMTLISALLYLQNGSVTLADAAPYFLPGLLGGFLGAMLSEKLGGVWLSRLFGGVSLFAGVVLLLR